VGASGLLKTWGSDFVVLALTFGEGIGRYMNYIEGAIYDRANNSILLERAIGVVAGYQLKANDQWRFNFVYGATRNFDNAFTDFARQGFYNGGRFGVNRQVQQAHVGFFYTPIKTVDLGAEAMWMFRKTLAGETGDNVRINLLAKYYIN